MEKLNRLKLPELTNTLALYFERTAGSRMVERLVSYLLSSNTKFWGCFSSNQKLCCCFFVFFFVYSDSHHSNSDALKLFYLVFQDRDERSNHNYRRNSVSLQCVD